MNLQLKKVQQRLEAAKEAGQMELAMQLESRIAAIRKMIERDGQPEDGTPPASESSDPGAARNAANDSDRWNTWIQQAYLRTVSRLPTTEETERCRRFYQESTNAIEGTKGLLWALVNTKEFIVNH